MHFPICRQLQVKVPAPKSVKPGTSTQWTPTELATAPTRQSSAEMTVRPEAICLERWIDLCA
jgi:hypothetical protein